jgi:hypothetical protein
LGGAAAARSSACVHSSPTPSPVTADTSTWVAPSLQQPANAESVPTARNTSCQCNRFRQVLAVASNSDVASAASVGSACVAEHNSMHVWLCWAQHQGSEAGVRTPFSHMHLDVAWCSCCPVPHADLADWWRLPPPLLAPLPLSSRPVPQPLGPWPLSSGCPPGGPCLSSCSCLQVSCFMQVCLVADQDYHCRWGAWGRHMWWVVGGRRV